MTVLPTVLITGASGNLGAKLCAHFSALGWSMRLLDIASHGDDAITTADLTAWDGNWVERFDKVDTVIHLAGRPSPRSSWESVVRYNFDMTQNVYEAAVRGRARRLIFASSNWVMAGHRFDLSPLRTDMPPCPVNPYGVSKLVGERLGRSYHERHGLEVICFRIGYCQEADNPPGRSMGMGKWGQSMWLSNRDLCHGMERAVLAENIGFKVLNLMSDNPGMRWDIATTSETIGYLPRDGAAPDLSDEMMAQEEEVRRMHAAMDELRERAAQYDT